MTKRVIIIKDDHFQQHIQIILVPSPSETDTGQAVHGINMYVCKQDSNY